MTQHDIRFRLQHMLDNAKEALSLIENKKLDDLKNQRMLELSLIRLVEVVGEAAARISYEEQEKYSNIPWAQVVGMRNRLAHGYDQVDLDILWNTIELDLPLLIKELEKILES
ncbi:MAG: DUF86 domain-containing protein [Deltaproteobacteria bacterium]|nr:DUF86 domain-containing protein [Deltaproteobacteria bacterium]